MKEALSKGILFVHWYIIDHFSINNSFAGVSRSTTCVIAYLIQERAMTFTKALNFVRLRRPIVCPNIGFQKQLLEFERQNMVSKLEFQFDYA